MAYAVTTYMEDLEKISYVGTFEGLKRRHEIDKMRQHASPDIPDEERCVAEPTIRLLACTVSSFDGLFGVHCAMVQ